MVRELADLASLKGLRKALVKSGKYSAAQAATLVPEDPSRRIDAINAADFFYPSQDPLIHQAAKRVLTEVRAKVLKARSKIVPRDDKPLPSKHYPIVVAGAGPLAPFYAEVAGIVQGTKLAPVNTLVLTDSSQPGPFNVNSDLHLLQPGFLRNEPHQWFNLPLPSSLVELGILGIPATWKQGSVQLAPTTDGRMQVSVTHRETRNITAETVVLSLGLGDSVSAIAGDATSISKITSDGGRDFRAQLLALPEPITINIVGSGGAVASTLHVLGRIFTEIRQTRPDFAMTVNLWVKLSPGSLANNQALASHLGWMQMELLDLRLNVQDPELKIGSKPLRVGNISVRQAANTSSELTGSLYHYDHDTMEPFIDERGRFSLRDRKTQTPSALVEHNSLAINSAGQANIPAATELQTFLAKARELRLQIEPVLLGDAEGAHTLMLEIRPSGIAPESEPTGRVLIGTTQAIGILRAWRQNPALKQTIAPELSAALLALQEGHTKASWVRHIHAFYSVDKRPDGSAEIAGNYSFQPTTSKPTCAMHLAMPGAVGVSHSRQVHRNFSEMPADK